MHLAAGRPLCALDEYINSTGKTADSETDGEDFQEFELSPEAQESLEQFLEQEKLQENEEYSFILLKSCLKYSSR